MAELARSPSSVGTPDRRNSSIGSKPGGSSVLHKIKIALKKKPGEDSDAEFEAARANFLSCKSSLEGLVKDVQAYVDAAKVFVEAGARVSSGFAAYFGSLYDARDVPKQDRSLMIMASQSDMIHQKIAEDHNKVVAIMDSRFFQKVQKPLEQLRIVSADVLRRDTLRKENIYYAEKVSKLQDKASHGKEAKKDTERRERNEKHLERTSSEFAEIDAQTLTAVKQVFDNRFTCAGPFLVGFLEAERTLVNALHEAVVAVDSSYKQAQIAQKMPAEASTPAKHAQGTTTTAQGTTTTAHVSAPESLARPVAASSHSNAENLSESVDEPRNSSSKTDLQPASTQGTSTTTALSITIASSPSVGSTVVSPPSVRTSTPAKNNPFDMDEDSHISTPPQPQGNPFSGQERPSTSKPPPPPLTAPARLHPAPSNPFDDLDAEAASTNPFGDED